jgi:hypothetical protein
MANITHVIKLKKGAAIWNAWAASHLPEVSIWKGLRELRKYGLIEIAMAPPAPSGADLMDANLREARLGETNLHDSLLRNADLTQADLRRADLSQARLWSARLESADLRSANLRGAHLHSANLANANLEGTDLTEARFSETIFGNTRLAGAIGLDACLHERPSSLDFQTLMKSGPLPLSFLRGCGLPEQLIQYLPSLLNRAIEFYSCFISYSHADRAFARALHDTLQDRGIRCWLDEKQLLPGDDIYQEVDRGIRLWDKFLLCCSAHSLTATSWVDKEIVTVLEKEDELTRHRGVKVHALIPLDLDGYIFSDNWKSGYRAEIRRRLAADFTEWETDRARFDVQIENVIRALRADVGGREQPPQPRL